MDSRELALEVRRHIVRMTSCSGGSHVASALSCADILAVLYSSVLNVEASNPTKPDRDRFILSKGHASSAIYATLAECGFIPKEWLRTHCQDGSLLSGHVSHKGVPGVEVSTGSLGHGLSIAAGMAKAAQLQQQNWRAFVVLSDGECDEGSIWEAAMFASHHRLGNLIAVIDYNRLQSLGLVADTLALEPFEDKWRSFGWDVVAVDGHDHDAMRVAFKALPPASGKPTCFLMDTVKGKGISFMENTVLWHYRSPQGDEFARAMAELGVRA